jgi:ABC-2 family transporter protein
MLKALVVKELRESAGVVALSALAMVYALTELTGIRVLPWESRGITNFPFVYDAVGFYLSTCIGGMAIALGLKQTAWEARQGTFFFLLHRPVSRERVFVGKLAVGLIWVIILSATYLLIYAWWASTAGHVPAPFDWSMTIPAWQQWVALPLVYLGAFLSGIRPARWWGTRLAPLAAAILAAIVAASLPWFWLTLLVAIIFSLPMIVAIFHYMRQRDY